MVVAEVMKGVQATTDGADLAASPTLTQTPCIALHTENMDDHESAADGVAGACSGTSPSTLHRAAAAEARTKVEGKGPQTPKAGCGYSGGNNGIGGGGGGGDRPRSAQSSLGRPSERAAASTGFRGGAHGHNVGRRVSHIMITVVVTTLLPPAAETQLIEVATAATADGATMCCPSLSEREAEVGLPLTLKGDPLGLWVPMGSWANEPRGLWGLSVNVGGDATSGLVALQATTVVCLFSGVGGDTSPSPAVPSTATALSSLCGSAGGDMSPSPMVPLVAVSSYVSVGGDASPNPLAPPAVAALSSSVSVSLLAGQIPRPCGAG